MDNERPPRLWLAMWQRFALAGVLIVLLCGGATAAVTLRTANQLAGDIFPKLNQIHVAKGVIASIYTGGPKTFLILGSDKRYGSKNSEERQAAAHSDTILLVRFDPEQGQTSVLSVPRDLLVSIKAPNGQIYYPHKINYAYTLGSELHGYGHDEAAALAAETVERVFPGLGKLNGIIDVTFTGFIRLVDSLGCVYVNVDHRYFHENNGTPEADYTAINVQPGYQKLCYENALDYVRYRHTDSDFVRVARQQDFLRDLREQISPEDMLGKIEMVAKAVGRAISTNFPPSASVLVELTKLIAFSQEKPLRQVEFKRSNVDYMLNGESYVTSTPELEQETLEDFLHGDQHLRAPSSGARAHSSSHHGAHHGHVSSGEVSPASIDLYPTPTSAEEQAVNAAVQVPFPVLYPRPADRASHAGRGAPLRPARPRRPPPPRLHRGLPAEHPGWLLRRRGHRLARTPDRRPPPGNPPDREPHIHVLRRRGTHPHDRVARTPRPLLGHQHPARGTLQPADARDRPLRAAAAVSLAYSRGLSGREVAVVGVQPHLPRAGAPNQPPAAARAWSSAALTSASAWAFSARGTVRIDHRSNAFSAASASRCRGRIASCLTL